MERETVLNHRCIVCTDHCAKLLSVARPMEMYDLLSPQHAGFQLTLFLHGRYEQTDLQIAKFRLEERDIQAIHGPEVRIAYDKGSRVGSVRILTGCEDDPRGLPLTPWRGFEHGIIRVGKFLRWKGHIESTSLLPLAHLFVSKRR